MGWQEYVMAEVELQCSLSEYEECFLIGLRFEVRSLMLKNYVSSLKLLLLRSFFFYLMSEHIISH